MGTVHDQALAAAGVPPCCCSATSRARTSSPPPWPGCRNVTVRHPKTGAHRIDPVRTGLDPEQAVELITRLDAERRFHLIVIRGQRVAAVAAHAEELAGRLWTCVDDVPHTLAG